ncbi:hypothetical protein EGW08_016397 [Elysia chlorotica]|uniref:Chitin-binding type-2 domain-containing protein n=1 Tax=Elysia chlorotica TaxID=188477 RepID=A0A3S0ZCP2_ELYCH|nr:hypothetical protein EGW08_016397 [Elysia chlorotica]
MVLSVFRMMVVYLAVIALTTASPRFKRHPHAAKNRCPQSPNAPHFLYADPDDCTRYFSCSNGVNILMFCPSDLRFSDVYQVCVHPGSEFDTCGKTPASPTPDTGSSSSPAPNPSSSSSPAPNPGPAPNPYAAKNRCPQGPNAPHFLYADPDDCTKFFSCSNGVNILMFCPSDLRFSDVYQVCVHPGSEFDTCGKTPASPTPSPGSSSSPAPQPGPSSSPAPNPYAAKNRCPQGPNAPHFLYADPDDCTKFFSCSNGVNILMFCPSDLRFSDVYQVCVHPGSEFDTCGKTPASPTPDTGSSSSPAPQPGPSSSPAPNPYAAKNRCPQGPNAPHFLYADPDDCTKFFSCSNGVNILMFCPSDLRFSDVYQVCVHPGSEFDTCGKPQQVPRK